MKGLILTYRKFDPWGQRGINVLATALVDNGWDITFVSYPERISEILKGPFPIMTSSGKIITQLYVIIMLPYVGKIFKHLKNPKLVSLYERMHSIFLPNINFNEFDTIIIESGSHVMLANLLKGKRVIYRQSDPVGFLIDKNLEKYERILINNSDITLVANDLVFNYYLKEYPSLTKRMEIWENGFNAPPETSESLTSNPYNYPLNAVYVGLFPINWDYIVHLCRKIERLHIYVIGPYELKAAPKNLHILGFIDHKDLVKYIKFAQICIVPYQDLPNLQFCGLTSKIMLFMYYKKPIITINSGVAKNLKQYDIFYARNPDHLVSIAEELIRRNDFEKNYNINFFDYTCRKRGKELIDILAKYKLE